MMNEIKPYGNYGGADEMHGCECPMCELEMELRECEDCVSAMAAALSGKDKSDAKIKKALEAYAAYSAEPETDMED
jgi:hypothetical protein